MKKYLLISMVVVGASVFSRVCHADDWLISVGFSGVQSSTENGQRYDSSYYVSVWAAVPQAFDPQVGFYIGMGIPENVFDNSHNWNTNQYTLLNAGLTYKMADALILYAGPGLAYQRLRDGSQFSTEHNYKINANVGAVIKFGNFGINLSYDTAPGAFGIGFTTSSRVFE